MASVVIAGDVSGTCTLQAANAAGTTVLTLPTTSGTLVATGGAPSFTTVTTGLGNASAPSITFTGDTNTGIFSPTADTIAFTEGGTESMRIDSAGRVGIGTTTPNIYSASGSLLTVSSSTNYSYLALAGSSANGGAIDFGNQTIRHAEIASLNGSALAFYTNGTDSGTGLSERMRIASNGAIGLSGANYGTSGQVLTSQGSGAAPVWAATGITSGTAVNSSSGTSIDFTGIPSTAKRITVIFFANSTNGSSNRLVQLGTSGGIVTSGYYSCGNYGGGGGSSTAGFIMWTDLSAFEVSGHMVFTLTNGTNWAGSHVAKVAASGNQSTFGGGQVTLGGTLDRVRITNVNGTDSFDGGVLNVFWE